MGVPELLGTPMNNLILEMSDKNHLGDLSQKKFTD